jgi:hypothetical protein
LKNNFKEKEMKNKIFGLATAIALSMIAAGGGELWAQADAGLGTRLDGWQSPQSTATQGRIRSAADDFIRPDSYTSARIGNWFGVASFGTGTTATTQANLGYAKTLEKVYIAAYYGGTFWANLEQFNYTEQNVTWPGGDKTVPVYNDLTINSNPNNRIAVLIGVADMGFRFSYYTNHQSFNKKDISGPANTYYSSYQTDVGIIDPQLAWSMTKNLTENGIKPYVSVDLLFNRNYTKYETATTGSSAGEQVITSANYVEPFVQLGLGGYTFYTKEAFRLSADLEYSLRLRTYNNEYSYLDGTAYKTEKIKGLNATGLTENSYVVNWFRPSLSGQWGSGPLALRFKLDLNTTITSEGITNVELDVNHKLQKDGDDRKTTTFAFNPDFRLAMQWRIVPKLALNAGGRINVAAWQVETAKGSNYTDDKEDNNSSYKIVSNIYGATARALTAGVTFNPTDNLAFEASIGASSGLTGNDVNVFSTANDGLFHFGNILVGLKF